MMTVLKWHQGLAESSSEIRSRQVTEEEKICFG